MRRHRFSDLPGTPASHFTLFFYAAVSQVLAAATEHLAPWESLRERFPFLEGYHGELQACGLSGVSSREAPGWWRHALGAWEGATDSFLPVLAVRETTDLDHEAMTLVFTVGLLEEDARFGMVFEAFHGSPGQQRPTLGLLAQTLGDAEARPATRDRLRRLRELGLLHVVNPDAPRVHWALEVPGPVWDVMRGDRHANLAPWACYHEPAGLVALDDLIVPEAIRRQAVQVPALLRSSEVRAVIVRGPANNGRRTLLGAIARTLGRGMLEVSGLARADDERWRQVGVVATALHALPVAVFDLAPGETVEVPRPVAHDGPLGIVLGRQGGVNGSGVERAVNFTLPMPDASARRAHWLGGVDGALTEVDRISGRFRLTGGNIRRAAGLAHSYAVLSGRAAITAADVQEASRALNRQALDTLAVRVKTSGDWSQLASRDTTLRDLVDLEMRCRHRERLLSEGFASGLRGNCGVRALFRGPSGTGKTLAARVLASVLQADLYRLDLSTVVNKYIGETEKNLDRVLSRSEELDVILLLDEGDALLTNRTSVQTSTDRYANLETNYLLQRLESFDGILIVTTNAGERIDAAFERRMDVVVDFHQPEPAERWEIWQMHLPSPHAVDADFLSEVAARCVLTGGQIRNAVLHASLLALDADGTVSTALLDAAVRREYRKAGAVCPLRRAEALWMARG